MVSTRKWWFLLKHNQNDFVVKEFHIISMRTLIALSFVRDVFTNGQTYPTPRSLAGRRRSRRFSNHSLLFCPLPPPPQCVIIALSFSNVCKISTAFAPRKRFSVLSNGTFRAFGRFSQRLRSLRLGISRVYTPAEFIGRFDLKNPGFERLK